MLGTKKGWTCTYKVGLSDFLIHMENAGFMCVLKAPLNLLTKKEGPGWDMSTGNNLQLYILSFSPGILSFTITHI